MFRCGNPYTGTGDARYPENIKLSATSNTRCSKSNVLSVGESLFTPHLTHVVLHNLQQEIVEVTNVEMVSGTKQYTRSDRPVSTSLVYFRVLDLRVRYRLVNGKKIRPYCVLRLGNRHHRSGAFPAEGLQVHSRRTTVDDRQLSASGDDDAGNPGVLWEIPTSCVTPHCPSHDRVAKDREDNQARQGCERQEDRSFRDSCQEILVEVYNTAEIDTGLSIEGFEAEMLGVLRIKLSDIWTQEIRSSPAAGGILTDSQAGLGESCEGTAGSTKPAGHSDAALHACDAAETQCRTDRWFGGLVSPSSSCRLNRSAGGDMPASGDYVVEARLEASWGGCTLARSKTPCHDSFGQAVDPRNTSKSLSAQRLWEVQEPLQRKRWQSETGQSVLSAFQARSRCVESPRIKRRNARGVEEWEGELRDLVWNGVPREMREEVYMSLSGASSKKKLFEIGYYQSLVNTCDQLEAEGNEMHNVARERKEKGSGDTVKSGQSSSRRQDEKMMTTSDLPSEHAVPVTSVSPALPPKPRSHTTGPEVCCESTSKSSGSIDSSSSCSHGAADQRTRSVASARQNSPTVECKGGGGLNGVSRKRCAFKADSSSLAQGGSVNLMEDAGPMPCADRSLQGARTETQEDGRSSSEFVKLADDSFTPQEMEVQRQVWREIEGDVDRVFANGKTRVNSATGMATIRRLLRAYSIHNPAVGYCQGMNFVAGFLLEVVSEEAAFWLLDFFCEDLNPEYHTKSMVGARSDIAALKDVLRSELPRFHSRASEVDMPLELKLTQWLVVGFVNCFPPRTALRIFEVSFLEGSDVYFATALAFLRLHEAEILLGEDIADVVCTLDRAQAGMYEADILLNQAWRELTLRGKDMRTARVWHRNRVLRQQEALTDKHATGPGMDSGSWHGADGNAGDERDGWLQGRSSTGTGGSAWLVLVPKALADQMEAILCSLNMRAQGTTRGALTDGKLARPSLMPLLVGGVRWLMGGRNH